jgi:hypothetical protein
VATSGFGEAVADAWADAVVLVVDDNENNVLLLERLLKRIGIGRVVGSPIRGRR